MDKQSKSIKDEIIRITWWMRGGVSLSEAMQLSQSEREIIGKLIKDNTDASKKVGVPIF